MLVTRPTHRGSGIALLVETSNAEAHADMYINEYDANNRQGLPAYNQSDITYPWTSTVALNLPLFYVVILTILHSSYYPVVAPSPVRFSHAKVQRSSGVKHHCANGS